MDYLPHVDQIIYLRGIRRRMDYQTGIAGISAPISYEWMSQLVEVVPDRGSRMKAPARLKKDELRSAFARLERAGLIERVRDHGGRGLVFRCLLASGMGLSAGGATPEPPLSHPNRATPEYSATARHGETMSHPRATLAACAMSHPIQESGIREESEANASLCRAAPSRFVEFWDAWPSGQRKRDRHKAEQAWKRLKLDDQADMIISDVKRRAVADQQWLRGYAPMPTTYLNGKRWEDEFEAPVRQPSMVRASVADRNRDAMAAWLNAEDPASGATVIEGVFHVAK
jgi:hypothetical protein